ncbi:MAG: rRNA maturation RNase YbeY [Candidatus Omnitrophota bacterium]
MKRERVQGSGDRVQGIRIDNLHKKYRLNIAFIKKITAEILRYLKKSRGIELEIVFLNDNAISALNKKYKGRSGPTDVLSFGIDRKEFGKKGFIGEIFISPDQALRNSKIFKTPLEEEIILYVIHGILHLSGYDDERAPDKRRMAKIQDEILKYLWKKENLSKVLTPR